MPRKGELHRTVRLTETGLSRLNGVGRRYGLAEDPAMPSVNTVKRTLRGETVFLSTLERVWEGFGRCAAQSGQSLPPPVAGRDYVYAAPQEPQPGADAPGDREPTAHREAQGWISRRLPPPNRLFTGRQEVLDRLRDSLQTGPAALVADAQALTGLGGIGKTQAALAYAYRHRLDYHHVFWLGAETVETLQDGLAGLAEELHLVSAASSSRAQAVTAMYDWFRRQSGWLLVLDNADDMAAIAPHFPRHHDGHLLVTTRTANPVKWAEPVPLARFEREEGATLLLRRAGTVGRGRTLTDAPPGDADAAMTLCEEFGGLPLALDQAGAYLSQTAESVAVYLARYREHGLRLLDRVTDPEHASVTVTYTLALERLAAVSPRGDAADLVRLCAFLAPDALPEAIPEQFFSGEPDRYAAACGAVCGYSLAVRDAEQTLTLHRLVQAVIRDSLSEAERRRWRQRAVQTVAEATPDFEFEDWPLCDRLLPQWRLCAEYIHGDGLCFADAAYLLYQAGRYHRARALYAEAEAYTRQAVALAEAVHGPVNTVTADYVDELACLCRVLDRCEEAEALHQRAVEILETTEGPQHPFVASKLHNMALLYVHREEYARAEAPFARALAIYQAQPVPDTRLIATTLTQMAGVYRSENRLVRAEVLCRRALAMYEALLGPHHLETATACNNLALTYLTMQRTEKAEHFYTRALAINEQARGPKHPETGTVVWGLARVRWQQNRREEAEGFFQRALEIYAQHFGPEHFRVARIADNYAEFQAEARGR